MTIIHDTLNNTVLEDFKINPTIEYNLFET